MSNRDTVFISYAWENDEHAAWVKRLADAVERMPEFHVVFDQYELHAGRDLTEFMDRGLAASRIITVITPEYVKRAEQRLGGVGYESSVISADLVSNQLGDRCVPVLKTGDARPAFLRSKIYVDFRPPVTFDDALRTLRQALLRVTPAARPSKSDASLPFVEMGVSSELSSAIPTTAYTFNSFMVTEASDVAVAAAHSVAERPVGDLNPLFLYASAGCGKTHLLHAIAQRITAGPRPCNVLLVNTLGLISSLISSIRFDAMSRFRKAFASVDVLLLDDVEFLSGRERTQEECFNRFAELLLRQVQMVFASEMPPRGIPNLADRIAVQFSGGLVAPIGAPNENVLLQIARNLATSRGIRIPDELLATIAQRARGNPHRVRRTITRIAAAYSQRTYRERSVDFGELISSNLPLDAASEAAKVVHVIASHYGFSPKELLSFKNSRRLKEAQAVAYYVMRRHSAFSSPEIAEFFHRSVAEIVSGATQIGFAIGNDEKLAKSVQELIGSV
jgi:chromosomal replication initiator protein